MDGGTTSAWISNVAGGARDDKSSSIVDSSQCLAQLVWTSDGPLCGYGRNLSLEGTTSTVFHFHEMVVSSVASFDVCLLRILVPNKHA